MNLQEEKRKALLRVGVRNPQILGINKNIPAVISECFDAGVIAERERVKKQLKELGYTYGLDLIYTHLFPESEVQS